MLGRSLQPLARALVRAELTARGRLRSVKVSARLAPARLSRAPLVRNYTSSTLIFSKVKSDVHGRGVEAKKSEDFSTWYTQTITRSEVRNFHSRNLLSFPCSPLIHHCFPVVFAADSATCSNLHCSMTVLRCGNAANVDDRLSRCGGLLYSPPMVIRDLGAHTSLLRSAVQADWCAERYTITYPRSKKSMWSCFIVSTV